MSKQLNVDLSKEISTRIKSKAKQNFDNAYKAALALEEVAYVQGFLVMVGSSGKPIEHGWIEVEESIIDPTFPHWNKTPEEIYYFPAQQLSVPQLKAYIEEAKEDYPEDDPLPVYGKTPYEYYGDRFLGGSEYQAAYKLAEAKCKELSPPKTQNGKSR